MARLTVYKDNQVDSTSVSNLFIDEYMKDANDAQLKVYLHLLRMMSAHQATSVSDIADTFNHTEKDIIRALKYWEKRQLLDLDFDQNKTLVGIRMRDIKDIPNPAAGNPVTSTFVPLPAPAISMASSLAAPAVSAAYLSQPLLSSAAADAARSDDTAPRPEAAVSAAKTAMPRPEAALPRFTKPVYSADQLREFKNRENTAQLLFISETYIGKPLTPTEMKTILFFTDELHFSDDLIDYLLQYCVDKGKKDFKYIEKVAISWAEQGISTPEQAQNLGGHFGRDVYDIVKALGNSNMPTETEVSYINRWTMEFCFSKDIILEACRRTVLAVNSNRFKYADALLRNWHEQNVSQPSDILRLDELYRQKKKAPASASKQAYTNRFNQFAQNAYDFDALEKELLSN